MIKVLVERRCKPGEEKRLEGLLKDLRTSCMRNSSYISGETLVKLDDPLIYNVVGTWTRLEGWKNWENCQERQELLQMLMSCIEDEPKVSVYTAAGNGLGGFEMDGCFTEIQSKV
jgi:antibiotic biosynthesis monooxygenase (ABM) superfamily enzyme